LFVFEVVSHGFLLNEKESAGEVRTRYAAPPFPFVPAEAGAVHDLNEQPDSDQLPAELSSPKTAPPP
jgi:hypothetical protein